MITIDKPYIEKMEEKTRCYCDIYFDNEKKNVWFEVDNKYGDYLVTERSDAYVIGLLNLAMRLGQDIKCLVPMSDELHYNITTKLIPSLAKYGRSLKRIKVECELAPALCGKGYIGTGLSCGIDSFDAIKNHYGTEYSNLNLTHLCINNVGAFNECYKEYGIDKVREIRYKEAATVANELNLPLISTDSNFYEAIPQNHYLSNTYSCCFAIYMLKKFWSKYYLASVGLDYSDFTIIDNDLEDSAHYDLLTLQCFSTSGIIIYSESGEKTRIEKTMNISDFAPANKHLHVCVNKPYNCNVCTKCRRTLVSLDAIGKLDNFQEVFDIRYYKENINDYYKWLVRQHLNHDLMNEPVYQKLLTRGSFRQIANREKLLFPLKKIAYKLLGIMKRQNK